MDLTLNQEQVMFQSMFREFCQEQIAPLARETDEHEHLPDGLLATAAEQELLGAQLPEEYDGAELDWISACLLMIELGKACMSTAIVIATHASLAALSILEAGNAGQKEAYLPNMAMGESIGAFAFTEPEAGSDPNALQATAQLANDTYLLNGNKAWVSNATIAGLYIVFARAPGGITAFIVPAGTPGLTLGHREMTMGLRGIPIHSLYLLNCSIPATNRLGEEGDGLSIAENARRRFSLSLASIALGAAEAALQEGLRYAAERKQFGVPISTKQAIGNYMAESYIDIETLRHLLLHAAWKMDTAAATRQELAAVKLYSSRVARSVANRMVQVHGGYGFSDEYAVSRIYRDVRALEIMNGTSQIHQVALAQELFKGIIGN
ncbi:MAG: acyl-CoA dehydrogenase family protein [Anaerolineales bacterium]|nr:acyl-CoA dehydrogenase family protein [Anaerolineales bacterium]